MNELTPKFWNEFQRRHGKQLSWHGEVQHLGYEKRMLSTADDRNRSIFPLSFTIETPFKNSGHAKPRCVDVFRWAVRHLLSFYCLIHTGAKTCCLKTTVNIKFFTNTMSSVTDYETAAENTRFSQSYEVLISQLHAFLLQVLDWNSRITEGSSQRSGVFIQLTVSVLLVKKRTFLLLNLRGNW